MLQLLDRRLVEVELVNCLRKCCQKDRITHLPNRNCPRVDELFDTILGSLKNVLRAVASIGHVFEYHRLNLFVDDLAFELFIENCVWHNDGFLH